MNRSYTSYEKQKSRVGFLCTAWGLLVALLACSPETMAQKLTASVNKNRVAVGEVFQIDFTVNTSVNNFTPPSFNDFKIYSGPNQSSSMQITNGSMSQSITFSYYLAAKKEGTFSIGQATATAGSTSLKSNTLTMEVTKGGANPSSQGGGDNPAKEENQNNLLFARTTVNKVKAYVGEQLMVTHKVYTRKNLKGFQDAKFPSYDGFFAQEPAKNAQYEVTQETIDGLTYSVVELKKSFLFPQRNGKIKIDPTEIECVVREKSGKSNDPFEQLFGNDPFFGGFSTYNDVLYKISSNAPTIEVLPLPDKPTGFSGAVGDFSVTTVLDKEHVKENEAINLKITISGKGNLKLIDPPTIDFPSEFETYDPKTSENISTSNAGISGSKTFEYLIIPRRQGTFKIPPIGFHYFNPDKKNYVALPSKELEIVVTKGDANAATNQTPLATHASKEDIKVVGNDIRFIKTKAAYLTKKGEYFFKSPLFILGFVLPPVFFFIFLFLRRKYIKDNSNLMMVQKRRASRIAKKHLSQAEKAMKENHAENFYINILSALYNYISNKTTIPAADLSKEKVAEVLTAHTIPHESIQELIKLLDECEFARYAPGLQSGNLNDVYTRSETIITKIENEIA